MNSKRSLKWSIAVLTSPRPGAPKLDATLRSIKLAGFPEPAIHDDEGKLAEYGTYGSWRRCLQIALERPCNRVLILEDNVELSEGLAEYLECHRPPPGIASLYCSPLHDTSDSIFGWVPVHDVPKRACRALAYSMTPDIGRAILETAPLAHKPHSTDHAVGQWCKKQRHGYFVHSPSFAIHRGDVSCLPDAGSPQVRQCRRWVSSIAVSIFQDGSSRTSAEVVALATNEGRVVHVDRECGSNPGT